jgi:tRNA threonylcarbamoyladenosine biosynthesis protein TsaE
MITKHTCELVDEAATMALGVAMASCCTDGALMGFSGPLGAGKTTLIRAMLAHLGYVGSVKSPSYAVVETYGSVTPVVHHFDLYRIRAADELYELGIESYLDGSALVLVEWPENAQGVLPALDLHCTLSWHGSGRVASFEAHGLLSQRMLQQLVQVLG